MYTHILDYTNPGAMTRAGNFVKEKKAFQRRAETRDDKAQFEKKRVTVGKMGKDNRLYSTKIEISIFRLSA